MRPLTAIAELVRLGGRLLDILIGGLLLLIVAITLAATCNRYLFGGALPWSEELNLLLWVWMIQLAALRTTHIRIGFLTDMLPTTLRHAVDLAVAAISVAALGVLTWGAVQMADFVAGDSFVSMPWLSEKYEYYPLFVVGPVWMLIILANQLGWTRLDEEPDAGES